MTYLLEKTLPEDIHLHREYPDIHEGVSVAEGMITPQWEPSNLAHKSDFPGCPSTAEGRNPGIFGH